MSFMFDFIIFLCQTVPIKGGRGSDSSGYESGQRVAKQMKGTPCVVQAYPMCIQLNSRLLHRHSAKVQYAESRLTRHIFTRHLRMCRA